MNTSLTPEPIFSGHPPDERSKFRGNRQSITASARLRCTTSNCCRRHKFSATSSAFGLRAANDFVRQRGIVLRVPTIAEEDDRRPHRERDPLINERGQDVNCIKGLCAVHGIYHYEPLLQDRMRRLEQLRTGDERELPPRVKAEIRGELQRLELALQMIKAIDKERNAMALGKAPSAYGNAKKVQQLVKIGSIDGDCHGAGP